MPQVKQLFFDCDNTLVLSEDLAFEASGHLVNAILSAKGISDRYTSEQLIAEFVGQNFRAMMSSLQRKYNFDMDQQEIEHYITEEEFSTNDNLLRNSIPCEGSVEVLRKLTEDKNYEMAVVSSSPLRRIYYAMAKAGQDRFIRLENIYSATNSLEVSATKPDPAVYFHAMERLGVRPEECVAVEDSRSGATAAIRANVPCIAYVGAYQTREKQDEVGNMLMELGCRAVMYHWDQYFECLEHIEQS